MQAAAPRNLDLLVHASRRSLWCALAIILLAGGDALVFLAAPESPAAAMARNLFMLLPLFIVFAGAGLRMAAKGASLDPSSPGMRAILNDELRQASLRRAYRNGLAAVLLLQPLLALLLSTVSVANPIAVMAAATSLTGCATLLASLLYYDR